jgi:membrane protein
MMGAIRQGLESAMSVTESRPIARGKLVDLALVVGAAALVLVTVGITALGKLLQSDSGSLAASIGLGVGMIAGGLMRAAFFLLSIVVVLVLYRFVPARGLRIRDGIVGAIVTALLLQLISLASGWIYERTTRLSVVYGSLTAVLVFLYSVYLHASALLFGAEMATAWSRPETAGGGPVLAQLKRAVSGLFVRQKMASAKEPTSDETPDDVASSPRWVPRSH